MKILVSTHRSYPILGGLERHVFKYLKWISENSNHKIVNLSFGNKDLKAEINKKFSIINIQSLYIFKGAFPMPIFSFYKYYNDIKTFNPDVVHTHGRYFISTYIALVYSILNKKTHIHTEHIDGDIYFDSKLFSIFINLFFNNLTKILFKKAILITTVSTSAAKYLEKTFDRKIKVIENFLDLDEINSEINKEKSMEGMEFDNNLNTIVFPYRLVKSKGYKLLENLVKNNQDFNFIIAGSGEGEKYVKGLETLYPNVKFLGELTHKESIQLINNCDILLNLSFQEGLSTTLLEAIFLKKWIATRDLPSNVELLIDYPKTIFLNEEYKIRLFKNGDIYPEFKYTLTKTAKKYFEIYEKKL